MLFLQFKELMYKNTYAAYRLNFLDQIFKLVHIMSLTNMRDHF